MVKYWSPKPTLRVQVPFFLCYNFLFFLSAKVAKLVDALDLGSSSLSMGSSPIFGKMILVSIA